jgi:hypothetical protein
MNNSLRNILFATISLLLLLAASSFAAESGSESPSVWSHEKDGCNPGLYRQPKGPMALILFCEDALGTYIGLVYYESMKSPVPYDFFLKLSAVEKETYYKVWSLDNRLWQTSIWASDVTSYAWGPDGTKLYVATSPIYGSGGLYELDLVRRQHKKLAPPNEDATVDKPGPGYIIKRLNQTKSQLYYTVVPWNVPDGEPNKELIYNLK